MQGQLRAQLHVNRLIKLANLAGARNLAFGYLERVGKYSASSVRAQTAGPEEKTERAR